MKTVYGQRCDGGLAPLEHTLEAAGMRWRYLQWGDQGPTVVLWHGITSDAHNWWRVGPLLAGLGCRVLAPDLPGHGQSDAAPGGYAVINTARLLDGWLAELDIVDPILIGHSWGGMNALVHAQLPDARVRARALVLEDPALALTNDPQAYIPAFSDGVGVPPSDAVRSGIATANPRWHQCDIWWKAQARSRLRPETVHSFFYENAGINLLSRLRQLDTPTLLLLGDWQQGGLWRPEHIAQAQAVAPELAIEVIPNSGHNLHRDSWPPFSMTLGAFVRKYL